MAKYKIKVVYQCEATMEFDATSPKHAEIIKENELGRRRAWGVDIDRDFQKIGMHNVQIISSSCEEVK